MTIKYIYKFSKEDFGSGQRDYPKPKRGKGGWLWVLLEDPTPAELERVKRDFDLEPKWLEKFPKERKSVRYSFYPLAFVMVDYFVAEGKVRVDNVLFVARENALITIAAGAKRYGNAMISIGDRLSTYSTEVGHLLYDVLDFEAEENFEVLSLTEKRITQLEESVLTPERAKEKIAEIVDFKRELLLMWRRFWGSAKVLFSIKKGLTPIKLDTKLLALFDDVHDTYAYQMEIVSSQREVLTDALSIYHAVVSNRLAGLSNVLNLALKRLTWIMFLLTGIGLVLTVPNTVATAFGIAPLAQATSVGAILIWMAVTTAVSTVLFVWYWMKVKKNLAESEGAIELPGLPRIEAIETGGARQAAPQPKREAHQLRLKHEAHEARETHKEHKAHEAHQIQLKEEEKGEGKQEVKEEAKEREAAQG